jgi:hypothetical protein
MAYPDNPEVASSYSFQIYGLQSPLYCFKIPEKMQGNNKVNKHSISSTDHWPVLLVQPVGDNDVSGKASYLL